MINNRVNRQFYFIGALSGMKNISATESLLKMMKSAFYFTLKALFILTILQFTSSLFSHVEKWLDSKDYIDCRFYDVTARINRRNIRKHFP